MRWIRNPKGPVIALCETILHRLLLRGETVMHREGRKDVLLDVGLIRLPRNRLNDKPQRIVVGVRVFVAGAHWSIEGDRRKIAHLLLHRRATSSRIGLRYPAGLVQQLAHRDTCGGSGIGDAEPG